jgi:hypothetical protein
MEAVSREVLYDAVPKGSSSMWFWESSENLDPSLFRETFKTC